MKTILIAAAFAACAVPAFADSQWTAGPAQTVSRAHFAAGSVIWDCDSAGCRTVSNTSSADGLSACRALAHEVGKLAAFVATGGSFDSARLARCNASAKSTS
jgi:hypothetical protein